MDVLHSRIGRIDLLQLRGRLDASQVDALSAQVVPLADAAGHQIVLSLAELGSITSIGLRLILELARRSRERGGALALCELQGFVLEMFEISGFLQILPVEPTRAAAIERVSMDSGQGG